MTEIETTTFPVLPLRDVVVFPGTVLPLFVGREKSVRALDKVVEDEGQILLVTQKDSALEEPTVDDLYTTGTTGTILQLLKLPDGTVKVLVEGQKKVRLLDLKDGDYFQAQGCALESTGLTEETPALVQLVSEQFHSYVKASKNLPAEAERALENITGADQLADMIAYHLTVGLEEKQGLLEELDIDKRLNKLFTLMEGELSVLNVAKRLRSRVKKQMEKTQRDYYLNEQMKAIQNELNDGQDERDELAEFEEAIGKTRLSEEAREKARAELRKLKTMSPLSAEATVVRNYLDWILGIPWKKRSRISHDLDRAKSILNADHDGLDKVKERILEYLAVQSRIKKIKGPILCLVGPPGVGKTSLGHSIARATNRKFVRMSLGGLRDEAEMRGHRRTYIGSMPGRIIQGMKKAKTSNPLFLLDEIDKLGADWRGDPSSALLEILDPEQNHTFNDHYLEVDYDLSEVMFLCTANSLNMPQPLLDRMEIIRIPGYTEEEKLTIARNHILPKQLKNHGLKDEEFKLETAALKDVVRYYTREAGVRNLERELSRLARKAVHRLVAGQAKKVRVTTKGLKGFLGTRPYSFGMMEKEDQVGVVTGLAYTEFGGDILYIEAVKIPGKGKVSYTGRLGDVMKESIQAAEHYIKSRCYDFGIDPKVLRERDIHIHVPEAATPKDGPSAGVAMVTAIVSCLTGIPVRRDVAMTGEVTLRGRVLPIGGLKEKLLAALRSGITTAILPHENAKDIPELPKVVRDRITLITVKTIDEVLQSALTGPMTPLSWPGEDVPALPDEERPTAH